jgi:hypothetical protein
MDQELKQYLEERLGSFEARLVGMDGRLGSFETRFVEMDERMSSFETHIDERLSSFESQMDERFSSFESRIEGRLDARLDAFKTDLRAEIEDSETRLLTAFHGWARPMEIRVNSVSTLSAGFEERLALAEDRISKLERRQKS